jgi:hypothetical protein
MHPGALNYFFRRVDPIDLFNSHALHPAFFNADYERFSTRHCRHAFNACREATAYRAVGESSRRESGISFKGDVIDLIDTPPKCSKCSCLLYHCIYESSVPTGHKKPYSVLEDGICQPCNEIPPPKVELDANQLIGRVMIQDITLYNLKSVNTFTPNCPSVIATCGIGRRKSDISW